MRKIIISISFVVCLASLYSLDISLAEIGMVDLLDREDALDNSFTDDLERAVGEYDEINSLWLKRLPRRITVSTLLDASVAAYDENIYYMLYGTIYADEKWREARISLYERETDSVITVFYGKADNSRYDDFVKGLAEKICRYFYGEYDIEPAEILNKWQGFWELGGNLGYWGVLPDWNRSLSGITSLGFDGSLALRDPVFYWRDFVIYPKIGLGLDYSLGLNKPEFESFVYNSFQIRIPLEIDFEWRERHCFSLGFQLGDQIDWLVQSRLYGDTYSALTQTFVFSPVVGYEYLFEGTPWTIGLDNRLEFAFYDDLMMSYKPSVRINYRMKNGEDK